MNKYVLSTIMWVEALAKKEIEKCSWKIEEVKDRMVIFSGPIEMVPRINFWSRVWNKLYIMLWEQEKINDFDSLFDRVFDIDWKKYYKNNAKIVVKSKSIKSQITSEIAMQKVIKKAIVEKITDKSWETLDENPDLEKFEIQVLLMDDKLYVLLNTSWRALHMRWYREKSWEAPIKESLAASLVLLSNWRFRDNFYDPFCWSWTIAIEALMIAKNIAPWLNRVFAYEAHWYIPEDITQKELKDAENKEFDGKYSIYASDMDSEVIEIAKENAKKAWFDWEINFEVKKFDEKSPHPNPLPKGEGIKGILVSNPPYWERLKDEDLRGLYNNIDKLFRLNPELKWWVITSYTDFDNQINLKDYKKRKLFNGGDMCYFYKRK